MSAWMFIGAYVVLGMLTWLVIMFLSALNGWGVDDLMGPIILVFWPLAIAFCLMFAAMTWVNKLAERLATMYSDWRDDVRCKAREREREIELEQTTRRMEEARARRAARGKRDGSSN